MPSTPVPIVARLVAETLSGLDVDDDTKELAKIGMEVALKPGTDLIANVIGVLGGDALRDFRERQRERRAGQHAKLSADAIKLLQDRGVKEPVEPNSEAVDELAQAAECEPREDLRALWAKLLAAMFDPARAPSFRREFIQIAKQLEPLDAATLPILINGGELGPSRREFVATCLGVNVDEVALAFRNLNRLDLIWPSADHITASRSQPFVTPLGRRFLAAVQ